MPWATGARLGRDWGAAPTWGCVPIAQSGIQAPSPIGWAELADFAAAVPLVPRASPEPPARGVCGAGRRVRVPSPLMRTPNAVGGLLSAGSSAAKAARAILIISRFVWEVRALGCCSMSVL